MPGWAAAYGVNPLSLISTIVDDEYKNDEISVNPLSLISTIVDGGVIME